MRRVLDDRSLTQATYYFQFYLFRALEHAGLSIVPLDRHRTWFRFHSLFAELLQARLRLEHPGLEAELHARAADWLAGEGLGREAIPHALAAEGCRVCICARGQERLDAAVDEVGASAKSRDSVTGIQADVATAGHSRSGSAR